MHHAIQKKKNNNKALAPLFFLILNLWCSASFAQTCSCIEKVKLIIEKIENNYVASAGLAANKEYQKKKKEFLAQKKISEDICGAYIYEMLNSLRDKHLVTIKHDNLNPEFKPEIYSGNLMAGGDTLQNSRIIDGFWVPAVKDIKFRIFKDPMNKKRKCLVVWHSKIPKWKRGDIRGYIYNYKKKSYIDYWMTGYNKATLRFHSDSTRLTFDEFFTMIRDNENGANFQSNEQNLFLTDSISYAYIKIPNFLLNPIYADSLLKEHSGLISKIPHLIIDIKDNIGGSVRAFGSILPYLYTNPIRIESALFFSSEENIKMLGALGRGADTAGNNFLSQMKRSPRSLIIDSGYFYKQDSVYKYPSRISIIAGKRSASAAELFLIAALQSKKVTLYGENTRGAGDKLDAYQFPINCDYTRVAVPISIRVQESYKKDIDGIGIPPHKHFHPYRNDLLKYFLETYE